MTKGNRTSTKNSYPDRSACTNAFEAMAHIGHSAGLFNIIRSCPEITGEQTLKMARKLHDTGATDKSATLLDVSVQTGRVTHGAICKDPVLSEICSGYQPITPIDEDTFFSTLPKK